MDKLEKALEKARHQRGGSMAGMRAKAGVTSLPSGNVTIDEAHFAANRIIAHRTNDAGADMFRILRTQVLQAMNKSNFKTLAITSPNYGDGKTTIALNLALSIALDIKQTVLLVDLDLRKPAIHTYLGIYPQFGLTDYLLKDIPITNCLVRLPFERLTTLPSGKPLEHSSETLGSPKMAELAFELRSRYPDRLIIYDMPPILAQDDPIAFMPHVDAALLVIQDGVTRKHEIKRCLDVLSSTNIVGTVLNNHI